MPCKIGRQVCDADAHITEGNKQDCHSAPTGFPMKHITTHLFGGKSFQFHAHRRPMFNFPKFNALQILQDLDEDGCRSACLATRECKFFLHTSQLKQCELLKKCDRIGATGERATVSLLDPYSGFRSQD